MLSNHHHGHAHQVPTTASDDDTVPEPAAKRKTLAERAGETQRSNGVPRPVNGAIRSTAAAAMRNISNNSSISSRNTSVSSRQPSASSFSTRPQSVTNSYRPASSLSQSRSRSALPSMRPLPPADPDDTDSSGEQSNLPTKRKGTLPKSPFSHQIDTSNVTPRRRRKRPDMPVHSVSKTPGARPVDSQNTSRIACKHPPSPIRNISLSSAFQNLRLTSNMHRAEQDQSFSLSQEVPQCPKTPSQIPKLAPKTPQPAAGLQPSHVDMSPTKHTACQRTPAKVTYLTRDSNLVATAWDTKGRLEDMEVLYSQLKSQLDSASKENHGMEDSIEVYKQRSMPRKPVAFIATATIADHCQSKRTRGHSHATRDTKPVHFRRNA